MNINISTATRGKLHAPNIVPRWELIPCLWLNIWANFPPAPQVEFSLGNRYVSRTLCFLSQLEWTARDPDSKEGWNSLQWLKFRLVFHLTRLRDVWILCGDPRENPSFPPHLESVPHISWHLESLVVFNASQVTSPDSSWKFIGIPRSFWKLERDAWSPTSPPEACVLSLQA